MNHMFPIIGRVKYYDYDKRQTLATNILLYAESLAKATLVLEDHFGLDTLGISVDFVADEGFFFEVDDELAAQFMDCEGSLAKPIVVSQDKFPVKKDNF